MTGPGCDRSEESAVGIEPTALDTETLPFVLSGPSHWVFMITADFPLVRG